MLTLTEYARHNGFTRQHIHNLLKSKRIKGAKKRKVPGVRGGFVWMIPRAAKIA
jgi:hypothetical protein